MRDQPAIQSSSFSLVSPPRGGEIAGSLMAPCCSWLWEWWWSPATCACGKPWAVESTPAKIIRQHTRSGGTLDAVSGRFFALQQDPHHHESQRIATTATPSRDRAYMIYHTPEKRRDETSTSCVTPTFLPRLAQQEERHGRSPRYHVAVHV